MVDGKGAVVGDVPGDEACDVAIAQLEGARGNGGIAGVSVVGRENRGARAELVELTGAGDNTDKRERIGVVDRENGIVDDSTGAQRAGGAAVPKLERTGGNGGQAGEGVVRSDNGGARAELLKLSGAGDEV